GVPEAVHGDSAEEVHVARAGLIPDVRALAAGQQCQAPAHAHEVARDILLPRAHAPASVLAATTSVPMPSLVNSSTSTAAATRPPMIAAAATPPATASSHACSWGSMTDSRVGSIAASSSLVRCDTSESRFGQSAYRPG